MLRKFRTKNFLSFRDWQTLNLTVAANAPDLPGRFVQSVSGSKERLPTFVAIFGANASGKTNILRAITFLANFMRSSQDTPPNAPLQMAQFYGEGQDEEPTEFEVELEGKNRKLGKPRSISVQTRHFSRPKTRIGRRPGLFPPRPSQAAVFTP